MKRLKSESPRPPVVAGLAAAAMVCAVSLASAAGTDTNAPPTMKPGTEAKATQPAKKLTGADLYAMHCNRCHPERYATEFTAAQWKTIVTHMRVRANLPASQAKLILKYLQEDAGN